LNKKPEELLAVNPYGTVPTLIDRDLVLYEANIIMEYLDERFPHPPLMPVYPVARAKTRLMMHRIEQDWYRLADLIMIEPENAIVRQKLQDSLTSVAPLFETTAFFLSDEFSLLDCALTPLLWRLDSLGINLGQKGRAISQYAERIFARPCFKASLTETEEELR
jgi:RNA polymerase-associated protein